MLQRCYYDLPGWRGAKKIFPLLIMFWPHDTEAFNSSKRKRLDHLHCFRNVFNFRKIRARIAAFLNDGNNRKRVVKHRFSLIYRDFIVIFFCIYRFYAEGGCQFVQEKISVCLLPLNFKSTLCLYLAQLEVLKYR